jgi:hypothetical protein
MSAEQVYESELSKLREIAARRDFSSSGDAEYHQQLNRVNQALAKVTYEQGFVRGRRK